MGPLLRPGSGLGRFGRDIRPPEEIASIERGDGTYMLAVVRRDWVVLVPPITRTALFLALTAVWHDRPWQVFVVIGALLALHVNRHGLRHGSRFAAVSAVVGIVVTTYLALRLLRPLAVGVQIPLVLILLLLWLANDYVLWFYDVLIVTNLNLHREFLDVHRLDYEYRKACGDLRSFTYNEPCLPLLTWRLLGAIFGRPDLGMIQFESAVQLDKPLNNYGPITHVNTFRAQFIGIREAKMRGSTPPPITPL